MTEQNNSLLPNGLQDLLPAEAEKESHIIYNLMQEFSKFGYARVKPPLVEFEETLLAPGIGQALAHKTFRMMDPVSGRMLGLRADTTAQIARIANSRLKDEAHPLRLSYAADVLKVNGSQLRPERQFCQVGCEMIGAETPQDEAELCLVALNSLHKAGVKNLSIDLTIPSLVDELYDAYHVNNEEREVYNKLLQKRDLGGIRNINHEPSEILIGLLEASGSAVSALKAIDALSLPEAGSKSIQYLKQVYQHLEKAFKVYGLSDIPITIDLIERRGFDYQNGMSFTIFSKNSQGELGRGGQYLINENDNKLACGFTLYMDSILKILPPLEKVKMKTVPRDSDWDTIKKLQDDGFVAIRK